MIIDSHIYCFEPVDQPAGYSSGEEHLRWVQMAQAGHHQPAMRVRDRQPTSSTPLNPNRENAPDRLPDVEMRGDHEKGRLIWTVDGEDCTKYQFPPGLRDVQYSPHSAICEMDSAGVDVALMHTDHSLGRDSAYLGWCVHQYPDRLRSMAPVDEWRVLEEMDSVILELQTSIHTHKLHAIKIIPHYFHVKDPQPWDDGPYQPFW